MWPFPTFASPLRRYGCYHGQSLCSIAVNTKAIGSYTTLIIVSQLDDDGFIDYPFPNRRWIPAFNVTGYTVHVGGHGESMTVWMLPDNLSIGAYDVYTHDPVRSVHDATKFGVFYALPPSANSSWIPLRTSPLPPTPNVEESNESLLTGAVFATVVGFGIAIAIAFIGLCLYYLCRHRIRAAITRQKKPSSSTTTATCQGCVSLIADRGELYALVTLPSVTPSSSNSHTALRRSPVPATPCSSRTTMSSISGNEIYMSVPDHGARS